MKDDKSKSLVKEFYLHEETRKEDSNTGTSAEGSSLNQTLLC